MRLFLVSLMVVILSGCGTLIPKNVELGQDKVEKFPMPRWREKEVQRQAAQRAEEKAQEVVIQAIKTKAAPEVLVPAAETAEITDALSDAVGPPQKRSKDPTSELADRTRAAANNQDKRVDDFSKDNDENVGKKIEGTGWLQVSYFSWLGGFLLLGFLGYLALKVLKTLGAAANPAVGVGLNVIDGVSSKALSKAFGQVIQGGKTFFRAVDKVIPDEKLRAAVKDLFVDSHKKAQDEDVQVAVKKLIKD